MRNFVSFQYTMSKFGETLIKFFYKVNFESILNYTKNICPFAVIFQFSWKCLMFTLWKMSVFGVFLVRIFRYFSVSLRILSESGKIRTRKTPNTDTFHKVICSYKVRLNFIVITWPLVTALTWAPLPWRWTLPGRLGIFWTILLLITTCFSTLILIISVI